MEKILDELSLPELFVLAACGKLSPLQSSNDLGGLPSVSGLHDRGEASHGPIQNVTGLCEVDNPLVEKSLKECGGDGTASEGVARSKVASVGHGNPPD
jgi:hypothetical protein